MLGHTLHVCYCPVGLFNLYIVVPWAYLINRHCTSPLIFFYFFLNFIFGLIFRLSAVENNCHPSQSTVERASRFLELRPTRMSCDTLPALDLQSNPLWTCGVRTRPTRGSWPRLWLEGTLRALQATPSSFGGRTLTRGSANVARLPQ